MGRKLAIDYEQQSFDRFNTRPDGLRPAAAWIGGLEIRDNGLWAIWGMDRASRGSDRQRGIQVPLAGHLLDRPGPQRRRATRAGCADE